MARARMKDDEYVLGLTLFTISFTFFFCLIPTAIASKLIGDFDFYKETS